MSLLGDIIGGVGGFLLGGPNGAVLGASLGGSLTSPQGTQVSSTAQNAVDPFAPYRASYAQQLNQLMQNPSSVQNMPGYQAQLTQGIQATDRVDAQRGQVGSGQEKMDLFNYGQSQQNDYFQQMLKTLGTFSGAGQSPSAGGAAGLNAGQANQTANAQQAGFLGNLVGALGPSVTSLLSGNSGGGTSGVFGAGGGAGSIAPGSMYIGGA